MSEEQVGVTPVEDVSTALSAIGEGSLREVAISQLMESQWNPRQTFRPATMAKLTESIAKRGIINPLIVRSVSSLSDGPLMYEIGAGHRRYRAACAAGLGTVPVIVRELQDADFLDLLTIDNDNREDVHPLEQAYGYKANMERSGVDVAALALKVGRSESYIYQRLKLLDLIEEAQQQFLDDRITAGHAILIARLQPKDQQRALKECQAPDWNPEARPSVRHLAQWIRDNVHLSMERAPFPADDDLLISAAGPCSGCPKRTITNPTLFEDLGTEDLCTDGACYKAKASAHLARVEAQQQARGIEVVRISQSYSKVPKGTLKNGEYEVVRGKDKQEDGVKAAMIVDGSDAGKIVQIRVRQEQVFAGPSIDPAERKAADEKREQQRNEEKKIRLSILDAVLAKVSWPPPEAAVRRLLIDSVMESGSGDFLMERHGGKGGWPSITEVETLVESMKINQLAQLIVELVALPEIDQHSVATEDLLALCKSYKVDAAAIRKAAQQPAVSAAPAADPKPKVVVPKPKKPAAKKKAPAKKAAKPKKGAKK